jgi:hypothetical protein
VFNFEACELLVFRRLLKVFIFGALRPRFQLLQVVRKLQYKVPAVQRPDLFYVVSIKLPDIFLSTPNFRPTRRGKVCGGYNDYSPRNNRNDIVGIQPSGRVFTVTAFPPNFPCTSGRATKRP